MAASSPTPPLKSNGMQRNVFREWFSRSPDEVATSANQIVTSRLLQSADASQVGLVRNGCRQSIAADALLLTVSQYAAGAIGLLMTVLTARLLGPAAYGTVALVISYPTILWTFLSFKPISVVIRYLAEFGTTGQRNRILSMCKLGYGIDLVAALAVLIVVGATGAWVTGNIYHNPDLMWLMLGYAISFPCYSLTGTSLAVLSASNRFRSIAVFQVLDQSGALLLVVGLIVVGFGVPGVIFGTAAAQAISGLGIMCFTDYVLKRDGCGTWWKASLEEIGPIRKELAAFFGWNYLGVTLSGLMGQIPLVLLGHFRQSQEVGFYRLATALITSASYLETSLAKVAYPILSARWATGERKSLHATLGKWTLREGLIVSILVLLIIPLLPVVVHLVLGDGYRPMVSGAQVMMVGAAVSAAFFWLNPFYYATDRVGVWAKAYALSTAAVISLGWVCVQRWGFLGLAIIVGFGKAFFTLSIIIAYLVIQKKSQ